MELTKLETTTKVKSLLISKTYDELAKEIGISKPTLFVRLEKHNWKKGESFLISQL